MRIVFCYCISLIVLVGVALYTVVALYGMVALRFRGGPLKEDH
jgi:hypothetical protein